MSCWSRPRAPRPGGARAVVRSGVSGVVLAGLLATSAAYADSKASPEIWNGGAPATYAQAIIERTLARHPDLKILAFHVTPPGLATNVIVASNIGRIGKPADADDLAVIRTGAPHAERTRNGYSVELVLVDESRRPVGALAATFAEGEGVDEPRSIQRALKIRDELAAEIPNLDALFAGAAADPGR